MVNTLVFESEDKARGCVGVGRYIFIICAAWFGIVAATALSGGFNAAVGERPLAILVAVLLPVLLFGIAYFSIKGLRVWVLELDIRHLILLHSWRMVGFGFVFLYFQQQLPALFAMPAGLGDAMTAIAALFLGIALYDNAAAVSHRRVYLWNSFGLLDFVVAVSMGVLTRTDEVLHTSGQAGSEIMGLFPLALIPGFAVPFYMITHLIIYAQLRNRSSES